VHRGAEPAVAESALLELVEQGYLDDARFARLFVQDKRELNQWGSARIRRALMERGISDDLAGAAVGEADEEFGADAAVSDAGPEFGPDAAVAEGGAELTRALAVLERRFTGSLAEWREWDRALGVLLRKGYEYELAVEALAAHRRQATAPAG
jgi:regulatory protein